MRVGSAAVIALSVAVFVDPAFALQSSDTMRAWGQASATERTELLNRVLGTRNGDAAGVKKCLDAASDVAGHADLEIGQVAKACAAAKDNGDPV